MVSIEAMPAICLACPTTGNNMNCSSALVAVPSVTTVFYTMLVGEPQASSDSSSVDHSRVLSPSEHAALAELMREGDVVAKLVGDDVGYLQIPHFSSMTPTLVFRALRRLGGDALTSLVLDLRGNPGGDTDAMLSLADDFLPPDAVIYRRIDEDGDETSYRARQADPYEQSLYLLVDGRTASAAELFAGCMQHHRRALVIGEPTFGKGQMQRIFPTGEDSGALYATIADCRLPDGTELQGRGIEPDVCVSASPDDTADPALAMALSHVSATRGSGRTSSADTGACPGAPVR
jgi:carboxyl-terminal processing protease